MFDAKEQELPTVYLGNSSPLDGGRPLRGPQVTKVVIMDEDALDVRMRTITHPDGIWVRHSSAPATWVESDDPDLESALSAYFSCPIGRNHGKDYE